MTDPKQIAMKMWKEERAAAQVAAAQEECNRRNAALALKMAEEEERLHLQQERELARLRAETALAAQRAREEQEALAAAVQAELERLRNRSEVEVLRDEMAELRREMAEMKRQPTILTVPLKQDGTPDMRYSSSKLYTLSVVANNGNLGVDPHHGTGKVLQVVYKVGDSETQTKEVEEHQTLEISGHDLKIYNAVWFTNPRYTRCTPCCNGREHHHQMRKQAEVLQAVLRFVKHN